MTPNDPYWGRYAPLTSKCYILYSYSTNIGTEYFKHCIYSQFCSLQNAVCFIILTYLVPVLLTFYLQGVLKLKKNYSSAKRLSLVFSYSNTNFYLRLFYICPVFQQHNWGRKIKTCVLYGMSQRSLGAVSCI